MKTTIISVVLLASATFAKPQPGLPFLLIWPTARSTALAGAMTGLADDPDAAFFNPAGLAFQPGIGATVSGGHWLPDFYQGMAYAYVGAAVSLSRRVSAGFDATFFNPGQIDIWLEPPYNSPPYLVWRGAAACNVAVNLSDRVALGATAKLIHSHLVPEWVWNRFPGLAIEAGGTGSTWACDAGVLWKPSSRFSVGGSVANIGPGISYTSSGEHDPLPAMLRLGACWTPVSNEYLRINVLPEFDKVLVGMFWDTTGRKTFDRQLREELRDAWKSVGVEVTGLGLVTVRLGYFEDMTWERGGIVFERYGKEFRHNVYDLVTRRDLGKFKSIGLCWGFGIGYKDYFRFDVSSDAAIYDFPTKNWKFALVANDIAGGIRELRQGHEPWEE